MPDPSVSQSIRSRLRLRLPTRRYLESQLVEWRKAHSRWSIEKLRLESERDEWKARALAAERELERVISGA